MTTDIFCFYLQNRLIQTSQIGGQRYSDTSPFSIPCLKDQHCLACRDLGQRDNVTQLPLVEWNPHLLLG
jgi:hypothetical protein